MCNTYDFTNGLFFYGHLTTVSFTICGSLGEELPHARHRGAPRRRRLRLGRDQAPRQRPQQP